MSDYETILYEVVDNRATTTLNRPDNLSAFERLHLGKAVA